MTFSEKMKLRAKELGKALVLPEGTEPRTIQASEKIIGSQSNVFAYSNSKDSLPLLAEKIKQQLANIDARNVVFFADMMGGSCWNLAHLIRKEYPTAVIISGVNLPMLLSFFTHASELPFPELIQKVKDNGSRGIQMVTGAL